MSLNVTLEGKLLFPSEYVGAADLKGRDATLTIAKIEVADLHIQGGKSKRKPVMYFEKTPKKLVLNSTNARTIAGLYGGECEAWVGKRITIYPTTTRCGGSTVDCVRVREWNPDEPRPEPVQEIADGV